MWGWLSDSELSELLAEGEEKRGGWEEARGWDRPCPAGKEVVREGVEEETEEVLLMVPLGSVFSWGGQALTDLFLSLEESSLGGWGVEACLASRMGLGLLSGLDNFSLLLEVRPSAASFSCLSNSGFPEALLLVTEGALLF